MGKDARSNLSFWSVTLLGMLFLVLAGGACKWRHERVEGRANPANDQPTRAPLTFSKDIAPIVWNRCASCHRPGQVAPFSLLSYADVKRRAQQIADVTAKRIMPPWLPEPGYATFDGERRLTADELATIQRWLAEGAVEGNPSELPPAPTWSDGWFLGKPDVIVTMSRPYTLAADGPDVYRNFVIPIANAGRRYVKGMELRPGNAQIVHHAFMYIDPTRQSRRFAAKDPTSGFPSMRMPDTARMPNGQSSYQPGSVPSFAPDGQGWTLEKDSDLVLQLHMHPTGKPETIQASVGLYFTDYPPTNQPYKILLTSLTIDISPGDTNYTVTDSFTLPVDVSLLSVAPHAHYLGREMTATANLPDGSTKPLIVIRNWNFNWQGEYRYAQPLPLPKGTTVTMRYTYDNSTQNVRNPNHPPKPVTYGPQSFDEMAELWLQVVVRDSNEWDVLDRTFGQKMDRIFSDRAEYLLRKDPADADDQQALASLLVKQGQADLAVSHYLKAVALKPDYQVAYTNMGIVLLRLGRPNEARTALERAIHLDPEDNRAHGSLGNVYLQLGELRQAEREFRTALRLNPDDEIARDNLEAASGKRIGS